MGIEERSGDEVGGEECRAKASLNTQAFLASEVAITLLTTRSGIGVAWRLI